MLSSVKRKLDPLGRILCMLGKHKYREDGRVCTRCLKLKEEKIGF